jgi:spore germination protein YaaH
VAAKLEIARRHHIAGIFAWRLGQEDPAIWPPLAAYDAGE